MNASKTNLPIIGWREWIALPDLNIGHIKAKVDSGARSSSLHALDIEEFESDGRKMVRFSVCPIQRNTSRVVQVEHPVLEYRQVRSSSGKQTLRPVIVTNISMLEKTWPVELTLVNRAAMGFRMLLGREAFRKRFLLDAGASFYGGRRSKKRASQ